ncbi:MAG: hypothetical protein MRJ68_21645 [Nitrospira sp.]|nr:hypothetical protein [Nitrospira sp.]
MTIEDARAVIVKGLQKALVAQEEGRLLDIGDGWDDAASLDHDDSRLSVALNLWEGWADSAEHDWLYYEDMEAQDWLRQARIVIEALEQDQPITDLEILKRWTRQPPEPSVFSRLVLWLRAI